MWNKPFCADLHPATFSSILHFLEARGSELAASSATSLEDRAVLTGFLQLLTSHFILAAESRCSESASIIEIKAADKVALERLLYR